MDALSEWYYPKLSNLRGWSVHISKVVIKNYRCLRDCTTPFNDKLNIIVGNNECGKSTLLEAIHLTLSGQLNGRPLIAELHPHLFNQTAVNEYIESLRAGKVAPPPAILIELYFADIPDLAACKGTNNSLKENIPGVGKQAPRRKETDRFSKMVLAKLGVPDLRD